MIFAQITNGCIRYSIMTVVYNWILRLEYIQSQTKAPPLLCCTGGENCGRRLVKRIVRSTKGRVAGRRTCRTRLGRYPSR